MRLEFLDSDGKVIKEFKSQVRREQETEATPFEFFMTDRSQGLPAEAGMNRFIWNMRCPDAESVPGAVLWGGVLSGPVAVPGIYKVRLNVGEKSMTQTWEWKLDPRLSVTQEELQEQFNFLIKIRDKLTEVNHGINQLRSIKKQVDSTCRLVEGQEKGKEVIEAGKLLLEKLKEVEDALIQSKSKSSQDPLNYPILLDNKIAALAGVVASAEARPTSQSLELFKELAAKADEQLAKLKAIIDHGLDAFNHLVKKAEIPAVIIK